MRIFYYPECNFNINKARVYDVKDLAGWFDSLHVNPDDYEIVGRDGKTHDSSYEAEVVAVYPKIMGGGKKKGKNILTAVVGLALTLATGGALGALTGVFGSATAVHTLGVGLLLSGGGALMMGQMKMPSMDFSTESSTKQNYQWNVGNLSTSRGVKGVTFGSDVVPEGELLAYRTYGTSDLETVTRSETYYVNEKYKTGRTEWNYWTRKYEDVYATRRVAKTRTINDSLKITDGTSFLELLIGCGEGVLDEITDIKVNDTPIEDLGLELNVDYAVRLGTNTQSSLELTDLDSQAGYSSIGQTVPQKLNGSVTPLVITTPVACDSCIISFQANNWYMYDTSSGAKNKAYIKPKIGYRASGSSGSYTYLTKLGVKEVDSGLPIKAESAFYFQVKINFPSNGTYEITLENDSAELNNTKGLLSVAEYTNLPDRAVIAISCDNIACYNKSTQTYPNTALIYLKLPASQLLNGSMPKVTWKQSRSKIYAYNGSAYVEKDADNLAWAIYDILAQVKKDGNTYRNEGESVNNIDYARFEAFATFCESIDAKGNWFLNKLDTSWATAMSVATSCRAFIGLRNGKACPYWDAPAEMTQIFTVGNYENMSGTVTAKKDRAKAIEATFNNEEENFKSRTVRVEIDNDHSAEAVSTTFVGLSTPASVQKAAHYLLRRNKYLVQTIKFTANIDSLVCEINDIIGVQCDMTEYGVGGRIFKVEGNKVSLSEPVTLASGNSYSLLVRHPDTTLERNTPDETSGTFTTLTFTNAWSQPVLKGDLFSFGITGSEVRKFRVTGITRTSDLKATIEAVEYNPNVYNELAVEPYTYTNPNAGINSITTTYNPESVDLAWDANNNTAYVDAYLDGVYIGRYERGVSITNVNSTQQLELVPVNEYGESSAAIVRTISNSLPTPSTPPVPIVHSTTTGCVAEFDGIPKNENIVWLVIKEGETELGRTPIMGEYMTVSIQLTSGSHTLTAYFLNQYNKTSQGRTFTGVPLGDMVANDISATALKLPTGSILRLSAKNCTTTSIAEANGVKDVSGNGNHGQAFNGVTVLDGGEGFGFAIANNPHIELPNSCDFSAGFSVVFRFKPTTANIYRVLVEARGIVSSTSNFLIATSNAMTSINCSMYPNGTVQQTSTITNIELNKEIHYAVTYYNGKLSVYVNTGIEQEVTFDETPLFENVNSILIGKYRTANGSIGGELRDFRIYPRALSASEIKTLYMFPDDVTFGQLTADLIGANVIKAQNLVMTENVISNAAQINNAVFQSLIVTNGSTVANQVSVGGRNLILGTQNFSGTWVNSSGWSTNGTYRGLTVREKSNSTWGGLYKEVNVEKGKSYTFSAYIKCTTANEEMWLTNGTATISAVGRRLHTIYTDWTKVSLTFDCTASGTIRPRFELSTASGTLSVCGYKLEEGNKATDWTPAPEDTDASINAITTNIYSPNTTTINGGKITTNTIKANSLTVTALNKPYGENFNLAVNGCTTASIQLSKGIIDVSGYQNNGLANNACSVGTTSRGSNLIFGSNAYFTFPNPIGTSTTDWTIFLWLYIHSLGNSTQTLFQSRTAVGKGISIFILGNTNKIRVDYGSELGSPATITAGWHKLVVTRGSSKVKVYLDSATPHEINAAGSAVNVANNAVVGVSFNNTDNRSGGSISNPITANSVIHQLVVWKRELNADEVDYLIRNGMDAESGQITADRIATDAIRGRNASGGGDGSYTTSGLVMNLSGAGWLSTQKCSISSSGVIKAKDVDLTGKITASSGSVGMLSISSDGVLSYSGTKTDDSKGYISFKDNTTQHIINSWVSKITDNSFQTLVTSSGLESFKRNLDVQVKIETSLNGSSGYEYAPVVIKTNSTSYYGLYVYGKARINSTDYTSDEKTKKDFQDVSTLDKLKALRVCAWRFDEEKLVEKENAWIDSENIKIEAENKAIDEENAEIEKENELRKNRKDGETVELLPLKEHKKLREHRIADKNANHPLNIGCMAGDFNKAFGTNNGSEDALSITDTIGVCMRAIQELAGQVDNLALQIASLKDNNSKEEESEEKK